MSSDLVRLSPHGCYIARTLRTQAHLKPRLLATVLVAAAAANSNACIQAALAVTNGQSLTTEAERQRVLRKVRFAEREMNLPLVLSTSELRIKTDKLEIEIATHDGDVPDMNRLLVDEYETSERKIAVEIATIFSEVWSRGGDPAIQHELEASEDSFDEANRKCHPRDEDNKLESFDTVVDARSACADLDDIATKVRSFHVSTPHGWHSVFQDDSRARERLGYTFLVADARQLKLDKAVAIPAKERSWLIAQDESLLRTDKQIWIIEMDMDDTKEFNARHPEETLDSVDELFAHAKKFRQDIAEALESYRATIRRKHAH